MVDRGPIFRYLPTMATETKEKKSVQFSPLHGRKLDMICEREGRKIHRQIELYIDADFDSRNMKLEDAPEAAGDGNGTSGD